MVIAIGVSRLVEAQVTALAGLAMGCVFLSGLGMAASAAAFAALVIAGLAALRREAFREGARAVSRLVVDLGGRVEVSGPGPARVEGRLAAGSFVAPWLTVVRWRPAGARFARTVLVPPDAVDADAFRRLRVLLRWG